MKRIKLIKYKSQESFKHTQHFCTKCGFLMQETKVFNGYDGSTGEPKYVTNVQCPNDSIFNWGHDIYECYGLHHLTID